MSTAVLVIVLAVALGGLALVFNHVTARLGLVELALNEGLPPRVAPADVSSQTEGDLPTVLEPGLHIFVSRGCYACQSLIGELGTISLTSDYPVHMRYVDRPRPEARVVADRLGAQLVEDQAAVAALACADPLPYTVALGKHGLVEGRVTPTANTIAATGRSVGITVQVDATHAVVTLP